MQTNLSLSDFKEIRGMRFCSVTQSMGVQVLSPTQKGFLLKKACTEFVFFKKTWGCLCKGLNVNCGYDRQDVFCLSD